MNANTPWSIRPDVNRTAQLLDREGNAIAYFHDWQNTEYVLLQFAAVEDLAKENEELEINHEEEIGTLENKILTLEDKLAVLEEECAELTEKIKDMQV